MKKIKYLLLGVAIINLLSVNNIVALEDEGIDITSEIIKNEDKTIDVVISEDIAELSPTIEVICELTNPCVKLNGKTIKSTFNSSSKVVSFEVNKGGTYKIQQSDSENPSSNNKYVFPKTNVD